MRIGSFRKFSSQGWICSRSAFYSLQSSGRQAQRINTAAKDLSTISYFSVADIAFGGIELIISNRPCVCFHSVPLVDFTYGGIELSSIGHHNLTVSTGSGITNYNKVSRNMILLTNVCCKSSSSLNRVELFGSGQFITDDSYMTTYKGANERKCVTDLKTNAEKFVSSPTPVSSYQEHLDQSRLSSAKADTLEAYLVEIKDDASIDSYYSYCDAVSRRECHDVADTVCADVQETFTRQQCTSSSSGSFPKFLTYLLQCKGILAGISLNPERSRDPIDVVKIRIVSQASSATIPSNLNERKCSDQQVPRTTYTILSSSSRGNARSSTTGNVKV